MDVKVRAREVVKVGVEVIVLALRLFFPYMNDTIESKKPLSRREFFKKTAKACLPWISAIVLSTTPTIVKAGNTPMGCTLSCYSSCSDECAGTCVSTCNLNCSQECKGGCTGNCKGGCIGSCKVDCMGTCSWGCGSSSYSK